MKAHDRTVHQWFEAIRNGQLTLPRFQRFEAWEHSKVAGLLNTILDGLPSGACLVLNVGDKEIFPSRHLSGAPQASPRVLEQLLDGQQRLTALWRSLNDDFNMRNYYVSFSEDSEGHPEKHNCEVISRKRYYNKKGNLMPAFLDDPAQCWERGLFPARLLAPGDLQQEVNKWINEAIPPTAKTFELNTAVRDFIGELRQRVREYNLPYLDLPSTTKPHVALDVFVKMNTSSVQLSTYDIIVALVEDAAQVSLHELTEELRTPDLAADKVININRAILDTSALMQDKPPSERGFSNLDFRAIPENWHHLKSGIRWVVELLKEEMIFDVDRLPSTVPLPVIAALGEWIPKHGDELGHVRKVLKTYLWRSFLTDRYDSSTSNNALQDYRKLRDWLEAGGKGMPKPNIFDDELYTLPAHEDFLRAPWPKKKATLSRAMLALQNRCAAYDIADGTPINANNVKSREYHHLYPDARLIDAGLEEQSFRAVNCALVTWKTNRKISAKEPIKYLKERIDSVDLAEDELKRRLRSHLIPWEELNQGGYDSLEKAEADKKLKHDYKAFQDRRAKLIRAAAEIAFQGRHLTADAAFAAVEGAKENDKRAKEKSTP